MQNSIALQGTTPSCSTTRTTTRPCAHIFQTSRSEENTMVNLTQDSRFDFDIITRWITPGERVLDLGCGDGDLLAHLIAERKVKGYGIERDVGHVVACIKA